jgi:hypothetical protein
VTACRDDQELEEEIEEAAEVVDGVPFDVRSGATRPSPVIVVPEDSIPEPSVPECCVPEPSVPECCETPRNAHSRRRIA